MRKLLFNLLSMVLVFSLFSCDDDDDAQEIKPSLKLEAVEVSENNLIFNYNSENADKVAYICQKGEIEVVPTPEKIIAENKILTVPTSTVTINNLESEMSYTIFAVAINDKNHKSKYSDVAVLKFITDSGIKLDFTILENLGCTAEIIKTEQEKLGNKVSDFDEVTRTLIVTTIDPFINEIKYYFDEEGKSMYSLSTLTFDDGFTTEKFIEHINKLGWTTYKESNTYEYSFSKDGILMRFFAKDSDAQKAPALLIGKVDESLLSWTRTDVLTDPATGMFLPLTAAGSSIDLIRKYEFYNGHTVNKDRTNIRAQFYAFNTGNDKYPMMGYWMDIKTNKFLEQAALYIDKANIPTEQELDRYITQFGFEKTPLIDGNMNPIYYKKDVHAVCCPEVKAPASGENYAPKLRFYFEDLTSSLPKEKVDIPWPNTEFGKITMQEAFDWYKAKGYTVDPVGFMGVFPLVTTNSVDFPQIILMPSDDDENIYYAASLLTEEQNVITSPDIKRQLIEKGYHEVESSTLPRFQNEEINVSAQIDLEGMFGPFSIGFNPIGA